MVSTIFLSVFVNFLSLASFHRPFEMVAASAVYGIAVSLLVRRLGHLLDKGAIFSFLGPMFNSYIDYFPFHTLFLFFSLYSCG